MAAEDAVVRMMMKMGYKPGEGLGRAASGEVQLAADKMITTMKRSPFDRIGLGHTSASSTGTYMDYNSAIQYFSKSNELCGEHHVTWYNIGICYYYMVCFSLAPLGTKDDEK